MACRTKPSTSAGPRPWPHSRLSETPSGILNIQEIQRHKSLYMSLSVLRPAMLMQIDRQTAVLLG